MTEIDSTSATMLTAKSEQQFNSIVFENTIYYVDLLLYIQCFAHITPYRKRPLSAECIETNHAGPHCSGHTTNSGGSVSPEIE